jgi:hypothetical protein
MEIAQFISPFFAHLHFQIAGQGKKKRYLERKNHG